MQDSGNVKIRQSPKHDHESIGGHSVARLRAWLRDLRRRVMDDPQPAEKDWPTERIAEQWARTAGMMLRFRDASEGNKVDIFWSGDDALEAIWNAVEHASRRVWVEVYTIAPDRVGRRTIDLLVAAATRGCEVILVIDAVGSSGMTEAVLHPLRDVGARVVIYNPIGWNRAIFRRDHRKIITVDDTVAFCGGMNLTEDYAGSRWGNGYFRDCHLRLAGPCVADFVRIQRYALSDMNLVGPRRALQCDRAGSTYVQLLESDGRMEKREIQRALRLAVRRTLRYCWITTPYFVPPKKLIRSLNRAARRGLDVRIITAGRSDVPLVAWAAHHVYPLLLKRGVRIFKLKNGVLHAKTAVMDGIFSMVGSFNLDYWSEFRNLEIKAALIDPSVAGQLVNRFEAMLAECEEVTLEAMSNRTLWQRLVAWAAFQLMRL